MPNCMRYRIDHCEFPHPDTLERIYELKPSVTIQPGYSWMDKRFMRSYERMLDKDIINSRFPCATLPMRAWCCAAQATHQCRLSTRFYRCAV